MDDFHTHREEALIEIKIGPLFSAKENSWKVVCKVANRGQQPVHVKRVYLKGSEESTGGLTCYEDLVPATGRRFPILIEAGDELLADIDGEKLASTIWDLGDCDCIVTTSDGNKLVHQLKDRTGEQFKLMCLTDSVRIDDGQGGKVLFPWTGNPAELLQILEIRENKWKLDFLTARGFLERRCIPGADDRYFPTEEGRRFLYEDEDGGEDEDEDGGEDGSIEN